MAKNHIPIFPGISRPSSDFPSVRSELRTPPMYRDVDLSVARSLSNGTAQTLPLCGNVVYIDQKGNSGYAVIHVQDDASVGNTPITVFPGFLARLPFTELILENPAQPGMVLRIIYGTDMDFIPVPGGGVSVLNAINVNDQIDLSCGMFVNSVGAAPVGFNVYPIVTPADSPRGLVVRHLLLNDAAGAGGVVTSFVAASLVAPTGLTQANHLLLLSNSNSTTARVFQQTTSGLNRRIPAGWGLYHVINPTVAPSSSVGNFSVEIL